MYDDISREEWKTKRQIVVEIHKAEFFDKDSVAALYKSVIGGEFCTWNEYYPGELEIETDLSNGNLYVMKDGSDIIGAASVVSENELDNLNGWSEKGENVFEIARIVVSPEHQGKGLACKLVSFLENILKERGCKAIHLLVAIKNRPAFHTYMKCGYKVIGECDMYRNRYFACEKSLI